MRRRLARNRWFLVYTLLNNPTLRHARKETGRRRRASLRSRHSQIWRMQQARKQTASTDDGSPITNAGGGQGQGDARQEVVLPPCPHCGSTLEEVLADIDAQEDTAATAAAAGDERRRVEEAHGGAAALGSVATGSVTGSVVTGSSGVVEMHTSTAHHQHRHRRGHRRCPSGCDEELGDIVIAGEDGTSPLRNRSVSPTATWRAEPDGVPLLPLHKAGTRARLRLGSAVSSVASTPPLNIAEGQTGNEAQGAASGAVTAPPAEGERSQNTERSQASARGGSDVRVALSHAASVLQQLVDSNTEEEQQQAGSERVHDTQSVSETSFLADVGNGVNTQSHSQKQNRGGSDSHGGATAKAGRTLPTLLVHSAQESFESSDATPTPATLSKNSTAPHRQGGTRSASAAKLPGATGSQSGASPPLVASGPSGRGEATLTPSPALRPPSASALLRRRSRRGELGEQAELATELADAVSIGPAAAAAAATAAHVQGTSVADTAVTVATMQDATTTPPRAGGLLPRSVSDVVALSTTTRPVDTQSAWNSTDHSAQLGAETTASRPIKEDASTLSLASAAVESRDASLQHGGASSVTVSASGTQRVVIAEERDGSGTAAELLQTAADIDTSGARPATVDVEAGQTGTVPPPDTAASQSSTSPLSAAEGTVFESGADDSAFHLIATSARAVRPTPAAAPVLARPRFSTNVTFVPGHARLPSFEPDMTCLPPPAEAEEDGARQ